MSPTEKALRGHHKVELVDDERNLGNGVIVTLKQGWTFEAGQDNRVRGEDSFSAALRDVRGAQAFAGPFDD